MKTLLRIDASARRAGSHTRKMADYYQGLWLQHNPEGEVLVRDLAADPVPHLSNDMIEAFQSAGNGTSPDTGLSDRLIAELRAADHILIGSPLYNGFVPSPLKAYFDHVVRFGHTFETSGEQYIGLLPPGKGATVITARGGKRVEGVQDDFQTDFLRSILAFMGISSVDCVELEAMSYDEDTQSAQHRAVMGQIDWMFTSPGRAEWRGPFTLKEKLDISALRDGQARAILKADARAYADLCADDVHLMVPGHDMIVGREALIAAEERLFAATGFQAFEKTPVRIERSGELAVETGRQFVATEDGAQSEGVYSSRQKYAHTLRKTADGWRFAILMSNPCA